MLALFQNKEDPENLEELSKEDLGRLVASRWTGEKSTHEIKEDEGEKIENQKDDSEDLQHYDEINRGYKSDSEIIDQKYTDDDDDDERAHSDDEYESDRDRSHAYNAEGDDDMEISGRDLSSQDFS